MIVYRPDGIAEEKDPVDARECVKYCGYSLAPIDGVVELDIIIEKPVKSKKADLND